MDFATEEVKFKGLHIRVRLLEVPELDFITFINIFFYISGEKKTAVFQILYIPHLIMTVIAI